MRCVHLQNQEDRTRNGKSSAKESGDGCSVGGCEESPTQKYNREPENHYISNGLETDVAPDDTSSTRLWTPQDGKLLIKN